MDSLGLSRRWVGNAATENPFVATLLVACLIHLLLILGINLAFPQAGSDIRATPPLEIMVLQRAGPTNARPAATDAFAQVERAVGDAGQAPAIDEEPGGESVPEIPGLELRPTPGESPPLSVLPLPSESPGPGSVATEQPVAFARLKPELELEPWSLPEPQPVAATPLTSEPPRVDAAEILASRNLEVAALTAGTRHDATTSAHRPRRKAISANTREYHYASYLEGWRRKVERVGNLNYPQEAKRRKLYGNLTLGVAIRADGSIERIQVLRSSGFDLLDEAAVRIVELAAPFAPFPPAIRAETDILEITRTWRFLSSNRLGWGR